MAHELEVRVPHEMSDIELSAREEIVERDDFVPILEQAFAEMGTEKAGAAGDENTHGNK